ncbi:MAG: hypothetical protein NT068_03750 [Candidatus Nomurabacteria bacterium]|nr:hypothetical protein [Candidatus Nomurabacteria bacterium]
MNNNNQDNNKPEKKVFKAVVVDTTDVMKAEARDVADEKMTMEPPKNPEDLKGIKKFFKSEFWSRAGTKIWKHGIMREYFHNKEIYKARKKILDSGNMYAGEGEDQVVHDKFVSDLMDQFSSEYDEVIHTEAGEMRKVMDGKKDNADENRKEESVKAYVKEKIKEYAQGKISEAGFLEWEKHLFGQLKGSIEGKQIRTEVMHSSNLLQIAKQIKLSMENGEILKDEDFEIDVIYGKSKAGVRTEAKYTNAEKWAEKMAGTKIGQFVNETTISVAIAAATSLSKKLSTMLANSKIAQVVTFGGTATLAAFVAKSRKEREMIQNRTHHSRDMAKGKDFHDNDVNRKEMEAFRLPTVSANSLVEGIKSILDPIKSGDQSITPEILSSALVALSDLETRIHLSDKQGIDLIDYSDPKKVVAERKALDIERSKLKVELRKMHQEGKLPIPEGTTFDNYLNSLIATQENAITNDQEKGINAKDVAFNKMKTSEGWKAFRTGFVSSLVIGSVAQEAISMGTGRIGIVEDLMHKNFNGENVGGVQNLTAIAALKHYFTGDLNSHLGTPGVLHDVRVGGNTMKLPEGFNLVRNPDHTFNLLNGKEVIGNHLATNPDGTFSKDAIAALHKGGIEINTNSHYGSHLEKHTYSDAKDYIHDHPKGFQKINRDMWYDNDTQEFDENELRTYWAGENGTGIDANGNYVLDVGQMTTDGSFHGELSTNAQDLLKEGKLKMLFTLSKDTQDQGIWVDIDEHGKVIIDKNSELAKLMLSKVDGHANFHGAFGEVAQVMDNGQVRPLGTMVGEGFKEYDTYTGAVDKISETKFAIPGEYDYRLPPPIMVVPGKPLEPARKAEKQEDKKPAKTKEQGPDVVPVPIALPDEEETSTESVVENNVEEVPFDENINNIYSIMTDSPKRLEQEIDTRVEQSKDLPRRNKQAFMVFESNPEKADGIKKRMEELKEKYPTAHFEFITPNKEDKEKLTDNDKTEDYMKNIVKTKMEKAGLNEDDVMNVTAKYK